MRVMLLALSIFHLNILESRLKIARVDLLITQTSLPTDTTDIVDLSFIVSAAVFVVYLSLSQGSWIRLFFDSLWCIESTARWP